ncbi:TPA: hypothetical protein N0F65_001065 [Lagenidium giganteum]|uniref:Uncharacterized protein n=1 Tax=Lagenidium giganteum TaxID=4803 RepID=A0AAV2YJH3_9STRA|nr:TPA: hypothetical protein N0F65_001065 [Lagenidium giganteum]
MINENVAKLILPRNLKRLHSSFNVNLLSHKLLKKRQFNRKSEWFVKWHGLPEKDLKKLSHWRQLLQSFKNRQREIKQVRGDVVMPRYYGQHVITTAESRRILPQKSG